MKHMICLGLLSMLVVAGPTSVGAQPAGPANGTLVLAGGADLVPGSILDTFLELAGGEGSPISYIRIPRELPENAGSRSEYEAMLSERFRANVTLLHSNNRDDWDSDAFAGAIKASKAVWVSGGIVGRGRVAIYDNERHGSRWFYYLDSDALFDLSTRTVQPPSR